MAINAKAAPGGAGTTQEPIEAGTYPARLVQVIDFGLQPQEFNGESKPPRQEIGTTYELLDEFMKDEEGEDQEDKPRWVSESFPLHNLAADRAKSTQRYYALDPNEKYEGDWQKLLGTPAMVTIIQTPGKNKNKGKIFNNVASVSTMRPKEAANAAKLVNEPRFFDLSVTDDANLQLFTDFPQWIKDKIKKGLEFNGSDFQIALESFKPAKKDEKNKKPREVVEVDDEIPTDDGKNW